MKKGRSGLWPVRCAPVSSVAVGSVLWLHGGQLYCTAIVKATFALVESGPMPRANPVPIRRSDDYLHGVPSLAGASEVAPRMDRVDVTIVGHAYAAPPVTKRAIRFTLVSGQQFLIDKALYVYGNRVKGGAPKPFSRMRIGYERALGGLDFPKNPIGLGWDEDSTRLPNIVHPKHPTKRVAGYGPIPARFQQRRQLRGHVKHEDIEDGIVEYPDDFAWDYFQAAPKDQRLDHLHGDEWLLLEGLHPTHKRVRARLPKARGLCRIYQRKPVGAPDLLEMRADMLHIEPDDDRCSLVWRGAFPIASELAAAELVVAGAVQIGAEPVRWPASYADLDALASPAPAEGSIRGARPDDLQLTVVSAGVPAPAPQRSLGIGYRLGEEKLELGAPAAPAPAANGYAEPAWEAPPVPPEVVPPPPSYRGIQAVPSAPGSAAEQGGGWGEPAGGTGWSQPGAHGYWEAQQQGWAASPSQAGHPSHAGADWGYGSGAWPAAPQTPLPAAVTPQPLPAAPAAHEHPMAGTDPMADPDGADASRERLESTNRREGALSTTDEMEDPDAEALDDADHPLALTEVVVELGDDDLVED